MATKKEIRQALICRLIRNNDVPNQKTLRELLLINGISATQATISRDMYELNITGCPANRLGPHKMYSV